MQITSYRSTYREQLDNCFGLIRRQAKVYKHAVLTYKEQAEIAKCVPDNQRELWYYRSRMVASRMIIRDAVEHYRNLVHFERFCQEQKMTQKIAHEITIYRQWSSQGLPLPKEARRA